MCLVCVEAFSTSVLLWWFLNSSSPSTARENGIGIGESKEDQLKKKLGEKFKRAGKGTTVKWKLSCKLIFPVFYDPQLKSTWYTSRSCISLNYYYHVNFKLDSYTLTQWIQTKKNYIYFFYFHCLVLLEKLHAQLLSLIPFISLRSDFSCKVYWGSASFMQENTVKLCTEHTWKGKYVLWLSKTSHWRHRQWNPEHSSLNTYNINPCKFKSYYIKIHLVKRHTSEIHSLYHHQLLPPICTSQLQPLTENKKHNCILKQLTKTFTVS